MGIVATAMGVADAASVTKALPMRQGASRSMRVLAFSLFSAHFFNLMWLMLM